jgi:hypothetical protein
MITRNQLQSFISKDQIVQIGVIEVINPNSPVKVKTAEKVKTADRIGQQTWGPPRTIELHRQPDKSLGISIVG